MFCEQPVILRPPLTCKNVFACVSTTQFSNVIQNKGSGQNLRLNVILKEAGSHFPESSAAIANRQGFCPKLPHVTDRMEKKFEISFERNTVNLQRSWAFKAKTHWILGRVIALTVCKHHIQMRFLPAGPLNLNIIITQRMFTSDFS